MQFSNNRGGVEVPCVEVKRDGSSGGAGPQKTSRGRNWTDIRGPAWATLGTAWSQVR